MITSDDATAPSKCITVIDGAVDITLTIYACKNQEINVHWDSLNSLIARYITHIDGVVLSCLINYMTYKSSGANEFRKDFQLFFVNPDFAKFATLKPLRSNVFTGFLPLFIMLYNFIRWVR